MTFSYKVKRLAKSEHENDIDNTKCGHVAQYHAVNHGHKRSGQGNGSGIQVDKVILSYIIRIALQRRI